MAREVPSSTRPVCFSPAKAWKRFTAASVFFQEAHLREHGLDLLHLLPLAAPLQVRQGGQGQKPREQDQGKAQSGELSDEAPVFHGRFPPVVKAAVSPAVFRDDGGRPFAAVSISVMIIYRKPRKNKRRGVRGEIPEKSTESTSKSAGSVL